MLRGVSYRFIEKSAAAMCRGCGERGLAPVLDYGKMPASDAFVDAGQAETPGDLVPLELVFCKRCCLLQILETVKPQKLFGDGYLYLSSCSDSWLAHCEENASEIISVFNLNDQSLVLELASNDGYLLQYFQQQGIPVLGIDPAPAQARLAASRGIETINAFFTRDLAARLSADIKADIVISNNVLAHVADIHNFIDGVTEILAENGCWIVEVPYVKCLVDETAFDTVYHEHLCYFSVSALQHIMSRHRLYLNEVRKLPTHGGSLRLYISRRDESSQAVTGLLQEENDNRMCQLDYYQAFAKRAQSLVGDLAALLKKLSGGQQRIAAYGAAAKGTILLNCLGEAAQSICFAADRNTLKHGKLIPGVDIPILPLDEIRRQQPDYLLLLPWNLREEIMQQQHDYLVSGGKFIVPLPTPEMISLEVL